MDLNQIRNILVNFVQKEWTSVQLESGLHNAQMKFMELAIKQERDLYQFKVKMGEGSPPLYVTSGFADIPSDFYYFLSMNVPSGGTYPRVRKCNDELFEYLRESTVENPTGDYPICRFVGTQIQFLPSTLLYVNFVYYKNPPSPVFGYTLTNGYLEYDEATSTQLDWAETDQMMIIQLVLQDLGVQATLEQIKTAKK
jgi:hypothetical protein